jgi:bacterioferritin-associated ferredoxin
MTIRIDRCICTDTTFAELLDEAAECKLSLDQLIEHTGASACCGMCGPYLRRAWRTGQTVFHTLLEESDEPAR